MQKKAARGDTLGRLSRLLLSTRSARWSVALTEAEAQLLVV